MLRAILKQMYVPNNYTTKDFRSQISAFMAREVHYFFPRMCNYLNQKGLTYESYIIGVTLGDISADEFMLLAISRMWNISISILSPAFNTIWNIFHESKNPSIVIIGNGREFDNKRVSKHYSPTEKTLPSARKLGHDISNIDIKYIQTRAAGEKAGTETFMIREREELLKQHYEIGKEIKKLKEKLSIYEEQFEVIGNRLCELEHDKDLLNRFRLHEEEREEGFQEIDAGKIPLVKPHVPNVPSKKRKISEIEDDEVTIEDVTVEIHGEETGAPDPPATTPAPIPTTMPTVAAALTTVATPTPAPVPIAISTAPAVPTAAAAAAPTTSTAMASSAPTTSSGKSSSGRCSRQATGAVPKCDQDPTRFYCSKCPKSFKYEKGLKEHVRERCGKTEKMFMCGMCNKEFHHEESLLDHIGVVHTKEKRHKCDICSAEFFYRKELKLHFDSVHKEQLQE